MTDSETFEKIAEFVFNKNMLLNSKLITPEETLFMMIYLAETLGLPASKSQLERYRDHYYPKEEK